MARTFFTAPPTSQPTTSELVYTRTESVASNCWSRSAGRGAAAGRRLRVVRDAPVALLHDRDGQRHQFLDACRQRALGDSGRVEFAEASPPDPPSRAVRHDSS
jgi:hypothetical protein